MEDTEKYEISDKRSDELDNIFMYHSPKEDQQVRYVHLREEAKALAFTIERACPQSREKSLAITNLEQAIFWANASIARCE